MTETIKNFPDLLHRTTHAFYREVPSQVAARRFIDALINLLFPIREKKCISLKEMDLKWENLQNDLQEIIKPKSAIVKSSSNTSSMKFRLSTRT